MSLLAAALPWLLRRFSGDASGLSPWIVMGAFPLLTAVVGFVVGLQFPLATATAVGDAARPSRSAAGLYAADLLGASLGAATAGAVLIPVLGIPHTCLAAATVSAAMATLLALRAALTR